MIMEGQKGKSQKYNFVLLVSLCLWVFAPAGSLSALNIERAKIPFLSGDYKTAITEGERILTLSGNAPGLDELYYILGVSYLKDGNYLRASDIFEIILKEFKDSKFAEDAEFGLGDAYYLKGDYTKAEEYYKELLKRNPRGKLCASLYYRLSQTAVKRGDTQQAKEYLDKLKNEFPLNLDIRANEELKSISDIYYSVQVGSFSSSTNASNLCNRLIKKGYTAYVQEVAREGDKIYRVKVGRTKLRSEAVELKNKLSLEGYPARICP